MLFSEIIGQQEIKNQLIRTVSEQRIPHAQLFRGVEGTGKLPLAIAYAQYICCENRTATDSCGVCPSCLKFNKLAHPDLHFVFPVIKPQSKTVVCDDFIADFRKMVISETYFGVNQWFAYIADDKKQGMIYANESEEIMRKLNLKTYEAEYKIMIIWLPERMNNQCANKLLKIIEEPPAKTIFLLVSNAPDEILQTILSRTQHINVPRLTENEIEKALLSNSDVNIDTSVARHISRIAGGSYLKARLLLNENDENAMNFERFTTLMRLAWQVGNKKDYNALILLKKWSDDLAASTVGRERQKNFLAYAQRMTRENFIRNLQQPTLNYLTDNENNFSVKFSPFINERNVESLMSEFGIAERQIEQNANARFVFFDLTLKMIMMLKR